MGVAKILVLVEFLCDASLCSVVVAAACVKQLGKLCENIVAYLV